MKQRLIDANKAENALYGFTRYTGIDEAPYEHAEAVINKLPTVEAIPIDWIRKWQAQHSPTVASYLGYMLLDWWKECSEKC